MSGTHIWNVSVTGDVSSIIRPESAFYPGPFNIGETEEVAHLLIQNVGSIYGLCNCKLVEYPGEANENTLEIWDMPLEPDGIQWYYISLLIPSKPGELWPIGIKTWGESETEPPWGTLGKTVTNALIY